MWGICGSTFKIFTSGVAVGIFMLRFAEHRCLKSVVGTSIFMGSFAVPLSKAVLVCDSHSTVIFFRFTFFFLLSHKQI